MKRITKAIKVVTNPYRGLDGRPMQRMWCEYVNAQGNTVKGVPNLQSILDDAGLQVEPGDVLTITVEVNGKPKRKAR